MTTSSEASSSAGNRGVRLAELLATVSLASDLAHDVPAERLCATPSSQSGSLGWPAGLATLSASR